MDKRKNQRMKTSDYFSQNRTYLRQSFSVFDRNTDHPAGHVIDISAGGMMMISRDPVEVGKILKLRIELPEAAKVGGRLMVDARCVWCKQKENPTCHYMGLKFMSISPDQVEIIEKLIEQYAPVAASSPAPEAGGTE